MIRLQRLMPLLGGLLLSRGARRVAGRHAGKLTLAVAAYEVWRNYRKGARPQATADAAASAGAAASTPDANPGQNRARPTDRRRWSGRRPR